MSLSPDLQLVELGLDALEDLEVRSLVWGLVDVALTTEEVDEALRGVMQVPRATDARRHPDCTVLTPADLRKKLVEVRALFAALDHQGSEVGWRTRMAEGVRLLAQLRQLFPKHKGDAWPSAPTLVADYRLLRRPRRYPKRDLEACAAKAQLATTVRDPAVLDAVSHWLSGIPPKGGMARFQVEASARILQGLEEGTRSGTLVSAGTGSGKTLAFYLPALAWLASRRVATPAANGVRVLALYPRNELLKDQLAEVFEQCRRFDDWIARQGGRPLRVGVIYGETPTRLKPGGRTNGWERHQGYATCPFFRCPRCSGELRALDSDLADGVNRLVCGSCGSPVEPDTLAYTREQIAKDPPDILFTSVEMLNRHLPSVELRHVFGVGPGAARAPDLVLMDEVHLYTGTYGAQVAYLMRRWWSATRRRSSFVGLSATLANGRAFFASLTGLAESAVQEVKPREQDMVHEGAEYLMALRGDPVSQSALLSTSIQTLMLGTRLLDPRDRFDKREWPFFGWRSFAFTDQLDAVNRLYRDLLDAEGRFPNSGQVNPAKPPLAQLREPMEPPGRRLERGQDWRVPAAIGHPLRERLGVSRTTSYDAGVSTHSEVVVATAALEVGFDDEAVGLVVQHKAPRDMASFLQRKGRAGRTRHTRPWTVVVLSDYGRDRMAYQAYDQLFDPELPPRQLPLANRYVQRMQAAYALLDDIGDRMEGRVPSVQVWQAMSGPVRLPWGSRWSQEHLKPIRALLLEPPPQNQAQLNRFKSQAVQAAPALLPDKWTGANWLVGRLSQRQVLSVLSEYVQSEANVQQLTRRLADRLALPQQEMAPLLWEQPRPIVLGAIPTAQRRLSTNWRLCEEPEADYQAGHPLPDFVPANLFDDLSLPEMRLDLPARHPDDLAVEYMPVQQALSEFAPGRVSRRFTWAYWLGYDASELEVIWEQQEDTPVRMQKEIDAWYEVEARAPLLECIEGTAKTVLAFRPLAAHLARADGLSPFSVGDTSNAQVRWGTQLLCGEAGDLLQPPSSVGISALIHEIRAHTHARQNAAVAKRYATSSRAEMRVSRGQETRRYTVECEFVSNSQPCGVGFEIDTDALVLVLNLPTVLHTAIEWSPERLRAARAARYNYEVQRGEQFSKVVPNLFLRNWIAQIFLIAGTLLARKGGDLRSALDDLAAGKQEAVLLSVLTSVFQAPEEDASSDRLRESLLALLPSPEVLGAVRQAARVLVDPVDAEWEDWLSLTLRTTLGAACLQGIQEACPQVDTDALVVDVDPGLREDGSPSPRQELWISEINPGGNGLVEQIVEMLVAQPELLFRHIEAALQPHDLEFSTRQLRQVSAWLGGDHPDHEVAEAVSQVRYARTSEAARAHFGDLRALLTRRGQSVFHSYAVSLSMRFLRPNTPQSLDCLVEEICATWDGLEHALGLEIDVRVICALHSDDARLDRAFSEVGLSPPSQGREHWRVGVLNSILWSRGHPLRAVALPLYNRYAGAPVSTERLLLTQWLTPRATPIDPRQRGWLEAIHDTLRACHSATIAIPAQEASTWLPLVTQAIVTEPVQFDYLNVYARLTEVKRQADEIEWTFSIPEAL